MSVAIQRPLELTSTDHVPETKSSVAVSTASVQKNDYSVQDETAKIFTEGILNNPLMKDLPADLKELSKYVKFEGSSTPSIPINWRFAESISALKALEATMLQSLIRRKYNTDPSPVTINTDHASLFFMSPLISQYVRPDGSIIPFGLLTGSESEALFPNRDLHRSNASLHRTLATNIYRTKDGRFFHLHGSMNPEPTLTALGMSLEGQDGDTFDSVVERVQAEVAKWDAKDIDRVMNEEYKQAGTIAWTTEEYFASEHGQLNGKIGLYEVIKDEATATEQPKSWWPENESLRSSPKRPLAGLKVVDLTRVIASPSIGRSLAEMGASVMRVTSDKVTDMSVLHHDLNWGKWNCNLHLKDEADKEKLRALIREADVVVDGYRPGAQERNGFGRQAIYEMVKGRGRGIIHVRENCYGWYGPWAHRSGWQQISDACCGISTSFARAMGNDEAVTPVFPNSDYCTGVCGSTGVLDALIRRAEQGGNYGVDTALNYYSQWLARSVGTYPSHIWSTLRTSHDNPVFRHYHNMGYTIPALLKMLREHDSERLFRPEFFERREAKGLGATFVCVKPVARFEGGGVELGYQVGTRGNGVDKPVWPRDLGVERVE